MVPVTLVLSTLVFGVLASAGCLSTKPSYTVDMESEPVALYRAVGVEKVRSAIAKAASGRYWAVIEEEVGSMRLLLDVRCKHEVVVEVSYAADSFRVKYVSSKNLDYDPETRGIHRKYIQWVRNLKKDIRLAALN